MPGAAAWISPRRSAGWRRLSHTSPRPRRQRRYNPAQPTGGFDGQGRQAHATRQDLQGKLRQEASATRAEDEEGRLKAFLVAGGLLAALAVALGAFGAHGLKARLTADALQLWNTAVQYHFWHALAVVAVGLTGFHLRGAWLSLAGWLFVAGIVLFSGSLYALALGAPRTLGMVAPIGGTALIAGWLAFVLAALRT